MKFLTPFLKIKSMDDTSGVIEGYASVFNVEDGYGDVVEKGAFTDAIAEFYAQKSYPKLLWQHDAKYPIGIIEHISEDDYGLFIKCKLLMDIPKAREAYALLKNKAIDGLSIGYTIKSKKNKNGKQYLVKLNLLEVSVVTFPACAVAVVDEVKHNCCSLLKSIKNISMKINNIINKG